MRQQFGGGGGRDVVMDGQLQKKEERDSDLSK